LACKAAKFHLFLVFSKQIFPYFRESNFLAGMIFRPLLLLNPESLLEPRILPLSLSYFC